MVLVEVMHLELQHIWERREKIASSKALVNVSCLLTFLLGSKILSNTAGV